MSTINQQPADNEEDAIEEEEKKDEYSEDRVSLWYSTGDDQDENKAPHALRRMSCPAAIVTNVSHIFRVSF